MYLKLKKIYTNISIIKKATIWFLFCSILQKGIAFLTTPIFTRLMSTEQYGQYSIYITWFQILTLVTSFRLDYSVFNKGMSKYEKNKDSYTSTMQVITTYITILLFIIYIIFRKTVNNFTGLTTFLSILMFINVLFMNAISFWTIRERYDYKYKSVVLVTLFLTLVTTIISMVIVIIARQKGIARIISLAITQILIGVIIYINIFIKGKPIFNKEYAKFALKFNLPLIPHYLSLYILEQSDKIMIQKINGIEKIGIYSVAYSIGNAINIISISINQAITPWLYRKLKEEDYKDIRKNIIFIFMIVLSTITFFILMIPELLNVLASHEYSEAVYVALPIAASTFFGLVYGLFAIIEFYFDKNKFSMVLSGLAAVINIVLNAIFINLFDYRAAGYTTMICYAILSIGHLIYTNKILKNNGKEYIIKSSLMVLIILLVIGIVIISQFLYNLIYVRYLILLFIVALIIIKRKNFINKINQLKK